MPDTSELDSETSSKHKKVIKSSAISKIKKKKKPEGDSQAKAFAYAENSREEEIKIAANSGSLERDDGAESHTKTKQIYDEVKELRLKIRTLEDEKRMLKEESVKVKQDCANELRKAFAATDSDDNKVELLQSTVSELEVKKDKLELMLSKKDNDMEKLKRKLEDKDIDIQHMKDKHKELQQKVADSEDKIHKLLSEIKGFREQAMNAEQDSIALRKEIAAVNTSYSRAKDENQELANIVDKLREQVESRRDSIKHASEVDEAEFQEYKQATETLISDYKSQIRELEKRNDEVTTDYDKLLNDKEDEEKRYLGKLREANLKVDLLHQTESSLKATISELEKKVDELMHERLKKERSGNDSYSELEGKYKALEIRCNQATSKLSDREERVKALESKITQIEEEKIYMLSHEEQKRDELRDDYKQELEELKDKVVELENKNDKLLIEKDLLQQKLSKEQNMNSNSNDLMDGNEKLLSQIKKLQKQITEKDRQIIEMQSDLQSSSGSAKKGSFSRAHTNRKDGNRDRELAELSVENEFLTKQIEDLNERIKELEKNGRISLASSEHDGNIYSNMKEGHENPSEMFREMKQEIKTLTHELINI